MCIKYKIRIRDEMSREKEVGATTDTENEEVCSHRWKNREEYIKESEID